MTPESISYADYERLTGLVTIDKMNQLMELGGEIISDLATDGFSPDQVATFIWYCLMLQNKGTWKSL